MEFKYKKTSVLLKIVNNLIGREVNKKMSNIGLTSSQSEVLGFLNGNSDKVIYPIDIEKAFLFSRPTVTGILKRLEEKGFIELIQNPTDKRYKQIKVTEKSSKLFEEVDNRLELINKIAYKNVSKEEVEELDKILNKMLNNLTD